ncbi:MAG: hypothetical protein R3E01_19760 [Pirellulaceae bacterium]
MQFHTFMLQHAEQTGKLIGYRGGDSETEFIVWLTLAQQWSDDLDMVEATGRLVNIIRQFTPLIGAVCEAYPELDWGAKEAIFRELVAA